MYSGKKGKGRERKGTEGTGRERKGKEWKGRERNGKKGKGRERTGKDGKEGKGKERLIWKSAQMSLLGYCTLSVNVSAQS